MQRDQDWIREARAELAAARDLLQGGHWSWCCFTSQQAAEKALKAVCERLRRPHHGHNLNMLRTDIEGRIVVSDDVRMACARLTRLYTSTRYPDAFDRGAPVEQFYEADAHQAVQDAEEVMTFAEGLIGPP